MKTKTSHKKEYIKYFVSSSVLIVVLMVLFLSICYSAFNSSGLISDLTSTVRIEANIRVTDVTVESATNSVVGNINYNTTVNNNTYTGKVLTDTTFTNTNSQITYKVEVTNFGNTEMGIANITGLPNNLTYELDSSNYNLGEKICDSVNANQCTLGAKKYIYVTIKYKSGSGTNTSTNLNASFDLNFKEMHKIYYEGNTLGYVIDGGNKTVSLGTTPPTYIKVTGTYTNYSYTNGSATINNATSDIHITEVHKIYIGNVEQQNMVDHNGNITIDLGNNAPSSSSNITITGTYTNSSYTSPNLTINGVTTDIHIIISASSVQFNTKLLSLTDNETPDANGIYTPASGTGCTNKLIYDGTTDNNLRFVGDNPCNYVTFNGETWRIIGVFNNITSDPLVKIINATSAYSTSVKYNNNNKNGSKVWGTNHLYTSMSSTSAATNSMTQSVQWNVGGPNNSTTPAQFYAAEIATKSNSLPIGLINVSDYGFATDNLSSCASVSVGSWAPATCSTNHDWLYFSSDGNTFTITTTQNSNYVYRITTGRVSYTTTVNTNSAARAVVFLKASILYNSGDGSSGTPYTLKES